MSAVHHPEFAPDERRILLALAREGVRIAAHREQLPQLDLEAYPDNLRQEAACFVTLHKHGVLRGCTGTLVARMPLVQEVLRTAEQTALSDPRFEPVKSEEVPQLDIEVSVLTPPQKLDLTDPHDLPNLIRPGIDGVTLRKGVHRATFLPQVWKQIGDPAVFLDRLCLKMGLASYAWQLPGMEVEVYQVEEFSESETVEK